MHRQQAMKNASMKSSEPRIFDMMLKLITIFSVFSSFDSAKVNIISDTTKIIDKKLGAFIFLS